MKTATAQSVLTLLDAMRDPAIFGPFFQGKTWREWKVFFRALFGLKMGPRSLEIYQRHTGRTTPPRQASKEAWLVVGRRGGKSRCAALVAVFLACFRDYRPLLAPGERGTVMVIAADRKQARVIFRYIIGFLEAVPLLGQMMVKSTRDTIYLNNWVNIEVHTANFRAVRGYTIIAALCDEIAFWTGEESANPDTEILNGLRPGMATVPDALLLCLSTPYARRGALWDAYEKHYRKENDPILVWQADTRSMNPTVPEQAIEEAYAQDEAAAGTEYGADFRRDIESFISPEAVAAVVPPSRFEIPPLSDFEYRAFVDPSGGSKDSFTLAVAHREDEKAILDCVREHRPPFSPEAVVAEYAELLKQYQITKVEGDRYAGEWPREQFRKHGVSYEPSDKTKSELYLELLPAVNSGKVELLDNVRLVTQLKNLERRTSRMGRDVVDHAPNTHDDLINAAAGVLVCVAANAGEPAGITFW